MLYICIGIPWCYHDETVKKILEEDLNPYPKWLHPDVQLIVDYETRQAKKDAASFKNEDGEMFGDNA